MPIYEYVCQECGAAFELLIRGDEKPECPSCGKKKVSKQLSVTAGGLTDLRFHKIRTGSNSKKCGGR